MVATGCSGGRERPPSPVGPAPLRELVEAPYLLDPLEGYSREIDGARQFALTEGWTVLTQRRDLAAARAQAEKLLAGDPVFEPARLLLGQIELEEGQWNSVVKRLAPIVAASPQYTAAALTLARALDRVDEDVEAYVIYRDLAATSAVATREAGTLLPWVLLELSSRVHNALLSGDDVVVDAELARLNAWSPGSTTTLEAALEVAVARSDRKSELAIVAKLADRFPENREYVERRGDLELSIGGASAAVEAFQALLMQFPDDSVLAEKLERAKFRWRLDLLPGSVRAQVDAPELSRGALAALIYWVVPDVRYAKPASARIATDILDHPQREAIARVANLGLMQVDATLHRFAPEAPATQAQLLTAALTVMARHNPHPPACLAGQAVTPTSLCALAERCELVPDRSCAPGDHLSGAEAVEILRRALQRL